MSCRDESQLQITIIIMVLFETSHAYSSMQLRDNLILLGASLTCSVLTGNASTLLHRIGCVLLGVYSLNIDITSSARFELRSYGGDTRGLRFLRIRFNTYSQVKSLSYTRR
jgi:hypothetical protein